MELKDCYDSENLFGFKRNIPLPLWRHVSGRAPVLAVGIPPDQTSENSFSTTFGDACSENDGFWDKAATHALARCSSFILRTSHVRHSPKFPVTKF